jgi:ribosome-binding protein aMBF1 (putative translation factor)
MNPNEIKSKFDELLAFKSVEEEIDHSAQMLAFAFLSEIDAEMEKHDISKKKLAELIGTSPSFITQLFMGDRKPNWIILAKMQKALGITFTVIKDNTLAERLTSTKIYDHKKIGKETYFSVNESGKKMS